jgi:hypothetical protein
MNGKEKDTLLVDLFREMVDLQKKSLQILEEMCIDLRYLTMILEGPAPLLRYDEEHYGERNVLSLLERAVYGPASDEPPRLSKDSIKRPVS